MATEATPKKTPETPKATKAKNKVWACNLYDRRFGRVNEGDPVTAKQLEAVGKDSEYIKDASKGEK